MLDVNLFLLIAREGSVEAVEQPVREIGLELLLVEEVERPPLVAAEQPVAPARADRAPLRAKDAEWRGRRERSALDLSRRRARSPRHRSDRDNRTGRNQAAPLPP